MPTWRRWPCLQLQSVQPEKAEDGARSRERVEGRNHAGYTLLVKRFTVNGTNNGFDCLHCGTSVEPLANGSVRNHCPACLWSVHVDENPGDRASSCEGPLEPVAVHHHAKKGWIIVHRCERCGAERRNKAALDDPRQPDDYDVIIHLSAQPEIAS